MVTEDYVSFDTAKLLKEKGFNWNTDKQFNLDKIVGDYNITDRSRHPERYLDAPTLQMAMKWLRETKDIQVVIGILNTIKKTWTFALFRDFDELTQKFYSFKSYEESCEAGIRYCLENLI